MRLAELMVLESEREDRLEDFEIWRRKQIYEQAEAASSVAEVLGKKEKEEA